MLPSQYKVCTGVNLSYANTTQHYIDTGIYPSNNLEIDLLCYGARQQAYIFGARNTSSNTAAGQLGFYTAVSTTNYFAYNNARVSITSNYQWDQGHFYVKNNNTVWQSESYIVSATGSTGSFTGTRTMYVGGLNNAGTVMGGSSVLLNGLIIKENDVTVADLIPCYDTVNNQMGAYNLANDTFLPVTPTVGISSDDYLIQIQSTKGGSAFARTFHDDLVTEIYGFKATGKGLVTGAFNGANLIAIADEGYEFVNWADSNGVIASYDAEFSYIPESSITLTANFRKISDLVLNSNYTAKLMPYGYNFSQRDNLFLEVISASIVNDGVQKSTSTIICKEIPSAVHVGRTVLLYTPKGKLIYMGLINSIEGNTLTCREVLSIYDQVYVTKPTTLDSSIYTVTKGIDVLLKNSKSSTNFDQTAIDPLLYNKMFRYWTVDETLGTTIEGRRDKKFRFMSLYHDKNQNCAMPMFEDISSTNLEDFFQNLFNEFGVYVDASPYRESYIVVEPKFYKLNSGITLSDNYERISNVSVTTETQEYNALVIFNQAGATLRGMYAVKEDGTVEKYTYESYGSDYLADENYKSNVVLSDDNIEMIIAQNLTNSALNHKITFKLNLGGLFTLDKLKVGMPVNFYNGNKLYNSVITGINFEIIQGVEEIQNCTITLGKVRNNLTSKLNMGKVK